MKYFKILFFIIGSIFFISSVKCQHYAIPAKPDTVKCFLYFVSVFKKVVEPDNTYSYGNMREFQIGSVKKLSDSLLKSKIRSNLISYKSPNSLFLDKNKFDLDYLFMNEKDEFYKIDSLLKGVINYKLPENNVITHKDLYKSIDYEFTIICREAYWIKAELSYDVLAKILGRTLNLVNKKSNIITVFLLTKIVSDRFL